jgi:glycosyltransferase involved in cell wall biosynthesis
MRVSVIICTWNRAALLDNTLTALAEVHIPVGIDWEVLVVNNRCTDQTDQVLAEHSRRLPLRRLYEERAGKSYAANRAIAASRGDLLLWTDDDVLVEPDWLEAYVRAAVKWPDATFFGGAVRPFFEQQPPVWLTRVLPVVSGVYALIDPRPDGLSIGRRDVPPVGANMAIRRSAFDSVSFDPMFGPCRDGRILGEETKLIHELMDAGHKGVWVGSARVRHYTPAARMTKRYLWDYWVGMGRADARLHLGQAFALVAGAPRWALRKYLTTRLALQFLKPFGGRRWARNYCQAAKMKGFILEWRERAANAPVSRSPLDHCSA